MEQEQMEYLQMHIQKIQSLIFQMKELRNLQTGGVKVWSI